MKRYLAIALLALCGAVGCAGWERATFQTLAANQALLNGAQADYEANRIPHTNCVRNLITDAKAIDVSAHDAFTSYIVHKSVGADITGQQEAIASDLARVASLITQIKSINTTPCGAAK